MTSKKKTILLIVAVCAMIIGFVTYNVIKLVNTFSDDEKETTSSDISFSLTSPNTSELDARNPVDPSKLSDRELLESKQKPYIEGQQRMEMEQNPKNQPTVSFSSIFSQKDAQNGTGAKITGQRPSRSEQTLDLVLPTGEDIKPDFTASRDKKIRRRSAADEAYADLEEDIQTFYHKDKKTAQRVNTKTQKEEETQDAPVSELERRRRALQNGFDINSDAQEHSTNSNSIIVAVRGDQEVSSGQSVKLRVLEACRFNGIDIPRNTILDGRVSVSGSNRLSVSVNAIRVKDQTHAVELKAYDMYGQSGLPLTVDKGKSIGTEEISDAVENVARRTIGRSTIGKIVTGSFGELRKEGKKTILILDAQKMILK